MLILQIDFFISRCNSRWCKYNSWSSFSRGRRWQMFQVVNLKRDKTQAELRCSWTCDEDVERNSSMLRKGIRNLCHFCSTRKAALEFVCFRFLLAKASNSARAQNSELPMWHSNLTIVKLRYKTWNRSYLLLREKVLGRPSFILSWITSSAEIIKATFSIDVHILMWHSIVTIVMLQYKTWNQSYLLLREKNLVGLVLFCLESHPVQRESNQLFCVCFFWTWVGSKISWKDSFCCGCSS